MGELISAARDDAWDLVLDAIAAELVEKLPEFVTLRQFATLTRLDLRTLHRLVEAGDLVAERRGKRVGIVAADNFDFFRGRRLYRLAIPTAVRTERVDERKEIEVSSQTYELLWNIALHDRQSIEGVVRGLASRYAVGS